MPQVNEYIQQKGPDGNMQIQMLEMWGQCTVKVVRREGRFRLYYKDRREHVQITVPLRKFKWEHKA